MSRSLLADAFDHHTWATLRLFDTCLALDDAQLETSVPGTYGSILETLRHLVGADNGYLYRCSDERTPLIDEEGMSVAELRDAMARDAASWRELIARDDLDPDADIVRRNDDGSEFHAPLGIRLAQVLHHGTDHRSQVCTALTTLGIEPPEIDVWDFGGTVGRVTEVPATA